MCSIIVLLTLWM